MAYLKTHTFSKTGTKIELIETDYKSSRPFIIMLGNPDNKERAAMFAEFDTEEMAMFVYDNIVGLDVA